MPGLKLDARSYAILILAAIGVTLSVTLVAQQTTDRDTSRYRVEDPAAATRQVAEANREIARSNQMIAESIGDLAAAVREVSGAIESLERQPAQSPDAASTFAPPAEPVTPQGEQSEGIFEMDGQN